MKPLIILDRDGVINYDSDDYIKSPEEWVPIPESLQALALLHSLGFIIAVATNQSGIARRYYNEQTLAKIHEKMHTQVQAHGGKIDTIFYCPHHPEDHCLCRKPKPDLLHQIATHYQVSLEGIPVVGDSLRDIDAAITAGATPHLVLTGKGQQTLHEHRTRFDTIPYHDNLLSFAKSL